jgi:hypothetical protein
MARNGHSYWPMSPIAATIVPLPYITVSPLRVCAPYIKYFAVSEGKEGDTKEKEKEKKGRKKSGRLASGRARIWQRLQEG